MKDQEKESYLEDLLKTHHFSKVLSKLMQKIIESCFDDWGLRRHDISSVCIPITVYV